MLAPSDVDATAADQPPGVTLALALGIVGVFGALAIVAAGPLGVVAVLGLITVALVARWPLLGVAMILVATPLLAGFARGVPVPFLRPHELFLFSTLAGVGVGAIPALWSGKRVRLQLQPIDWAFLVLAITGSVIPVLLAIGRGRPVGGAGLGQVIILPKYFVLFILLRSLVRTSKQVQFGLLLTGAVGLVVTTVGVAQAFINAQVAELLLALGYQETDYLLSGRGSSTIGNAIIFGMLIAFHLPVSLTLLAKHLETPFGARVRDQRLWTVGLVGASVVFSVGVLSSGQFSPVAALIIMVVVVAVLTGRTKLLLGVPATLAVGAFVVWPQIQARIDEFAEGSGLPISWRTRIDNLERFYLPEFGTIEDWLLGVRLDVTADNDLVVGEEVFLESGYLWLLWVGGIFLLAAAVVFLLVAGYQTLERTRSDDPWVAAPATAAFGAVVAIALLLPIDQHLTLRASTDLFVALLAFSMIETPAPVSLEPT